jgi:hypothetical protein
MLVVTDTDKLGEAIYRTLQYYAWFSYPLKAGEILRNCGLPCSEEELLPHLHMLQEQGRVHGLNGYYSPSPDIEALVERRSLGNERAIKELRRARTVGRLIFQAPFVCFVGISGSLSKGYSDAHTDFDFFIITRKDRLWISRTLLHLFKKLTFLVGQQHKFCMNYFLDDSALLLEERNIYTATELSSMVPVAGAATYHRLMEANSWLRHFLPNYLGEEHAPLNDKGSLMKGFFTALLGLINPSGLNRFLMRLTDQKWRRKWARKGFPAEDYNLAFKTTLHISKNHPANYQKRILEALSRKAP